MVHPDLSLSNLPIRSTMPEEYRVGGCGLVQAANLAVELSTESPGLARHGVASPKARAAKGVAAQAAPVDPSGQVAMLRRTAPIQQRARHVTGERLALGLPEPKAPSSLASVAG